MSHSLPSENPKENPTDVRLNLPDAHSLMQWLDNPPNQHFSLVLISIPDYIKFSAKSGLKAAYQLLDNVVEHLIQAKEIDDSLYQFQPNEYVLIHPSHSEKWIQYIVQIIERLNSDPSILTNEKPNNIFIFCSGILSTSDRSNNQLLYLTVYQQVVLQRRKLSLSRSSESSNLDNILFPQRNKINHRQYELDLFESAKNKAFIGNGNILFLEGQAGIGKTKVINYFLERTRDSFDVFVLYGATQHVHTPSAYHAIKNALVRFLNQSPDLFYAYVHLLDEVDIRELFQFIPEMDSERLPEIQFDKPSKLYDFALFEALVRFITRISNDKKLVIWLEDFHDADLDSWQFIKYLASNISKEKFLLIISSRELDYFNNEYPDILRSILMDLKNMPVVRFHRVAPFDLQETIDYCSEFKYFKRLPTKSIEFIYSLTKGNPLYIYEISKLLASNPKLLQKIENNALSIEDLEIPSSVQDVVMAELSSLTKEEKRIIEFLSALGFEINTSTVKTIIQEDPKELDHHFQKLIEHNVLLDISTEANHQRVQFSHPMIRTVIYNTMGSKKRKTYHLQIAESMERYLDYSVDLVLLADHFYLAGIWEKAYKYAIACALQAKQVYAYQTAYQFFSRAREIAKYQYQDENFSEMVAKEGEMLELLGRYKEAYQRLSKSGKMMESKQNSFGAANVYLLMGKILHIQGQFQESLKILKKAKSLINNNVALFGFILGEECWIHRILGDYQQSISCGTHALEILERSTPKRETGLVYGNLAEIYYRLGNFQKAFDLFNRRLSISQMISDKFSESLSLNTLSELLLAYDRIDEAEKYATSALTLAMEIGNPEVLTRVLANQTHLYLEKKNPQTAHQTLDEAFSVAERSNYHYIRPKLYLLRAHAYLLDNDSKSAQQQATSALTLSGKSKAIEFQGLSYQLLGDIYCSLKNQNLTIEYYLKGIELLQPIHILQTIKSYQKLASCYQQFKMKKEYQAAKTQLEQLKEKIILT